MVLRWTKKQIATDWDTKPHLQLLDKEIDLRDLIPIMERTKLEVLCDGKHHIPVARTLLSDVKAHQRAPKRLDLTDGTQDRAVGNIIVTGFNQAAEQQLKGIHHFGRVRVALASDKRFHEVLIRVAEAEVEEFARCVELVSDLQIHPQGMEPHWT
jgi:hypothetical protein